MATWVQVVGQLTARPTGWVSACAPRCCRKRRRRSEIDGSWRTLLTIGVLLVWAVVGLALAPVLLRRMARRESGSSVAARREKALQRV